MALDLSIKKRSPSSSSLVKSLVDANHDVIDYSVKSFRKRFLVQQYRSEMMERRSLKRRLLDSVGDSDEESVVSPRKRTSSSLSPSEIFSGASCFTFSARSDSESSTSEDEAFEEVRPHVLPFDPRDWTRNDVHVWLRQISLCYQLEHIPRERFMMNGKALCLMTFGMFTYRVPDGGGKLLFRDFRQRLNRAMAAQAGGRASSLSPTSTGISRNQ